MGWGDPGAYGGGAAIGAATPNMDRLAREGLKLTSTYSQPTCTPTRSAILTGTAAGADRPDPPDPRRRQDHRRTRGQTRYRCRRCWAKPATPPCFPASGTSAKRKACARRTSASTSSTAIYAGSEGDPQALDKRRYPDLVLNPERLDNADGDTGASEALMPRLQGRRRRTDVDARSRASNDVAEGDRMLKEFTRRRRSAELATRRTSRSSSSTPS